MGCSQQCVSRLLKWLRGLDLNQRPLGYERRKPSVSIRKQGTGGNPVTPWERLETLIGDLMGTEFAMPNDLPNDLTQWSGSEVDEFCV
jgi:hypothetical protein